MNKYESIIIINPNIAGKEKDEVIAKYKELVEGFSNTPVSVEDLGKKKLAYEIRGNKEGIYVLFKFAGETENITELERQYKNDDNVIKFITIRTEEE